MEAAATNGTDCASAAHAGAGLALAVTVVTHCSAALAALCSAAVAVALWRNTVSRRRYTLLLSRPAAETLALGTALAAHYTHSMLAGTVYGILHSIGMLAIFGTFISYAALLLAVVFRPMAYQVAVRARHVLMVAVAVWVVAVAGALALELATRPPCTLHTCKVPQMAVLLGVHLLTYITVLCATVAALVKLAGGMRARNTRNGNWHRLRKLSLHLLAFAIVHVPAIAVGGWHAVHLADLERAGASVAMGVCNVSEAATVRWSHQLDAVARCCCATRMGIDAVVCLLGERPSVWVGRKGVEGSRTGGTKRIKHEGSANGTQ